MKLVDNISFVLASSLLLVSCGKSERLVVSGQLQNLDDGVIYMHVVDESMEWNRIDTATVKDGSFSFECSNVVKEGECMLFTTPRQQQFIIFAGHDVVTVAGDMDKPEMLDIKGSKLHDMYSSYVDNVPEQEHLVRLSRELNAASYDVDKLNSIKEEMRNAQLEQLAYIKKFIRDNTKNPVGTFVLINSVNYCTFDEVDTLQKIIAVDQPRHKYTKIVQEIVENRRAIYEAMSKVEVGQIAPDFELPNSSGVMQKLSDFEGSSKLINFWASNDRNSRLNNKTLSDLYKKFSGTGLDVIGVCVDRGRNNWLQALLDDDVPGVQLVDTLNIVAATYCVPHLPYCILLDGEGRIVAKDVNLKGEGIFADIESLLKK
ncbi:MAG: AhpC/TSA family protein [Marinilabiliaceae bacterium]|nr:AhpC/TSA family protein [Marinilabiliaceae bacterium]